MMKRPISIASLLLLTGALVAQQVSVPAYHAGPPPKGASLPAILASERLLGPEFERPYQKRAYELAAKISPVLYQQPCYCHCDRMGHTSLRSCYESTHAVNCGTCLQELYYTYQASKAGQTPRQIRRGIISGEWKQVQLESASDTR